MGLNLRDFPSVAALAKDAGLTTRTIYRLLAAGDAPRHEVMSDGRIYFYPDEAATFVERRATQAKRRRRRKAGATKQ